MSGASGDEPRPRPAVPVKLSNTECTPAVVTLNTVTKFEVPPVLVMPQRLPSAPTMSGPGAAPGLLPLVPEKFTTVVTTPAEVTLKTDPKFSKPPAAVEP